MRVVPVSLGERTYEIKIGPGLMKRLGAECQRLGLGTRCAIISDRRVAKHYARAAEASLHRAGFDVATVVVAAGETSKRLRTVEQCFDKLAGHRLERNSFIVALGGGVVGDLAGFVAASYFRGIPFVQVPTSLLAQVDSSVGGKTGVNLKAGKNLVGAFHQPRLVLCDLDTLCTLSRREYRAGLAEVIKYGIIYDAALFKRLERDLPRLLNPSSRLLGEIVGRCCEIKAEVVSQDETESGRRAILNFGHTIGHAIENSAGYGRFLHGEAISIGQVAAARLSERVLGLSADEAGRIRELFVRAGLPVSLKLTSAQRDRLLAAMKLDKKVSAGEIKFVLARKIGKVVWSQSVPEAEIHRALDEIVSRKP